MTGNNYILPGNFHNMPAHFFSKHFLVVAITYFLIINQIALFDNKSNLLSSLQYTLIVSGLSCKLHTNALRGTTRESMSVS